MKTTTLFTIFILLFSLLLSSCKSRSSPVPVSSVTPTPTETIIDSASSDQELLQSLEKQTDIDIDSDFSKLRQQLE